jgi:hypothetical protein
VSVKYKTKNITTADASVFLITINQIKAKTISSRNLTDIDTSVCMVVLSGSRNCPLKKMKSCKKFISRNSVARTMKSEKLKGVFKTDDRKKPPAQIRIYNVIRGNIYLPAIFIIMLFYEFLHCKIDSCKNAEKR